jgi:hypothetical protein
MSKFHIHKTARIGNLGEKQMNSLAGELAEMTLESDLRGQLQNNIKRLRDMGTYRGRRHAMGLPVRGQRTRTQVSNLFCEEDGFWDFSWLTKSVPDYDCKEVQPRGQTQVSFCCACLLAIFLCFFLTPCMSLGCELARRTGRIHHCKDNNVQKTLLRTQDTNTQGLYV